MLNLRRRVFPKAQTMLNPLILYTGGGDKLADSNAEFDEGD